MAGLALCAQAADNQVYNTIEFGEVNGVSDNGRYVAITDMDNHIAFMWDARNPEVFTDISEDISDSTVPSGQRVVGTSVYDFSDSGMGVGCIHYADGKSMPAVYKDGEWTILPIPANVRNTNVAIAVTPDGSHIAAYATRAARHMAGASISPCSGLSTPITSIRSMNSISIFMTIRGSMPAVRVPTAAS